MTKQEARAKVERCQAVLRSTMKRKAETEKRVSDDDACGLEDAVTLQRLNGAAIRESLELLDAIDELLKVTS